MKICRDFPMKTVLKKYSLSDETFQCVVDHDSDLGANVQIFPANGYSGSSSTRAFAGLHMQQLWDLQTHRPHD